MTVGRKGNDFQKRLGWEKEDMGSHSLYGEPFLVVECSYELVSGFGM